MEAVPIDLDISSDGYVCRIDEVHVFIHILVLPSFQELSFHHSGVLLRGLKDRDGVVCEVEGDNESTVNIFWHFGVESSGESKHFLVVIYVLKEISFWLVGKQFEDIP
jgi:hypothetical protein